MEHVQSKYDESTKKCFSLEIENKNFKEELTIKSKELENSVKKSFDEKLKFTTLQQEHTNTIHDMTQLKNLLKQSEDKCEL